MRAKLEEEFMEILGSDVNGDDVVYEKRYFTILSSILLMLIISIIHVQATEYISNCTEIHESGQYVLTTDIINSSGPCISILSSDVIFDGNGHTIDGINRSGQKAISAYNDTNSLTNVTVKNLRVINWNIGIYYNIADGIINNNTLSNNDGSGYGNIYVQSSNYSLISDNTLLNNNNDAISIVWSNNTVLKKNTLSNNSGNGIVIWGNYQNSIFSTNNIVIDNVAKNNSGGISLVYSNNNVVKNNALNSNMGDGIYLYGNDNVIQDNIANYNAQGSFTAGININGNNNYMKNNTVHGNGNSMFGQPGISDNGDNNIIDGNYIVLNSNGINIGYSNNNIVKNNNITNNFMGIITFPQVTNSTFYNNNISNNGNGISLESSSNNNTIAYNIIDYNHGVNEGSAIYLSTSNNTIFNNYFEDNDMGIAVSGYNNTIYNNYFNNMINAADGLVNNWNITKTRGKNIVGGIWLGGNYWSDYLGKDIDGDGLGNTYVPYNSRGNIQNGGDQIPLVKCSLYMGIIDRANIPCAR